MNQSFLLPLPLRHALCFHWIVSYQLPPLVFLSQVTPRIISVNVSTKVTFARFVHIKRLSSYIVLVRLIAMYVLFLICALRPTFADHSQGSVHIHFRELVDTSLYRSRLIKYPQVAGNLTISSASTLLMVRTYVSIHTIYLKVLTLIRSMALWEWKRWAVLSMLTLSL